MQELAEKQGIEVLKVLRGRSAAGTGMSAGTASDDQAIETLLEQPVQVFEHLLQQFQELDATEAEKLKTTFAVLLDLEAQSETSQA